MLSLLIDSFLAPVSHELPVYRSLADEPHVGFVNQNKSPGISRTCVIKTNTYKHAIYRVSSGLTDRVSAKV